MISLDPRGTSILLLCLFPVTTRDSACAVELRQLPLCLRKLRSALRSTLPAFCAWAATTPLGWVSVVVLRQLYSARVLRLGSDHPTWMGFSRRSATTLLCLRSAHNSDHRNRRDLSTPPAFCAGERPYTTMGLPSNTVMLEHSLKVKG